MIALLKALVFIVAVLIASVIAIPISIFRIGIFISDFLLHDILDTLNGLKGDINGNDSPNGKDGDGN